MPSLPLNDRTLARHAPRIDVPAYDRAALGAGVVHLSVGSFHRAHQAVYFDDLARKGLGAGWGIVGVGLRRPEMGQALIAQDGLYTLVARGRRAQEARVVGAMTKYLFAPRRPAAVLGTLAAETTRLVTLTVTPGGYHVDLETGIFAADDPAVQADLAEPSKPRSALGYVVEALDRRRRAGRPPFTVLSCDNMPAGGAVTRTAVLAFAGLRDPGLARWIETHGAFPSSMVDRITPRTTAADREMVERVYGVRDRWPVVAEDFSQWVIEDDFCHGRPPLEAVGAQFVPDVRPYALLKTRMLNASHLALGYLGVLAGHRRTHEAMADPVLAAGVGEMMRREIEPLLPPVPGVDVAAYRGTLLQRFGNPAVGDRLVRLGRNGSAKVPAHLLASIREARATGRPHGLLTLAVAGWCRFLLGWDDAGRPLELDDPQAASLRRLAREGGTDPRPLLSRRSIFGSLGSDLAWSAALARDLRELEAYGTPSVLAARARAEDRLLLT